MGRADQVFAQSPCTLSPQNTRKQPEYALNLLQVWWLQKNRVKLSGKQLYIQGGLRTYCKTAVLVRKGKRCIVVREMQVKCECRSREVTRRMYFKHSMIEGVQTFFYWDERAVHLQAIRHSPIPCDSWGKLLVWDQKFVQRGAPLFSNMYGSIPPVLQGKDSVFSFIYSNSEARLTSGNHWLPILKQEVCNWNFKLMIPLLCLHLKLQPSVMMKLYRRFFWECLIIFEQ